MTRRPTPDPWAHLKTESAASDFYRHAAGWAIALACVPYAIGWFAYAMVREAVTGTSP